MNISTSVLTAGICLAALSSAFSGQASGPLEIYYIDTEGGQSTLFMSPSGESLLVDAGNGGDRDLGRIVETLKAAGVRQIDHMWITHYHSDHVGSLLALAEQIPVKHFYDHGNPNPGDRIIPGGFYAAYEKISEGKRTIVKPGDKVAIAGLDVTTVAAAGKVIQSNLKAGGQQNAGCTGAQRRDESAYFDPDNGYSAGFAMQYGRFRTVDLGDLTWNAELDLVCPVNRVGPVDLYLTSHHGLAQSGSPPLMHALQPRVAIMNNGTRKGGELAVFKVLFESPGLEDLWQLHWSYSAGVENSPATFIANVEDNAAIASALTAPPAPARGPGAGPGGAVGAGGPAGRGGPGGPAVPGGAGQGPAPGPGFGAAPGFGAGPPGAGAGPGAGPGRGGGAGGHSPAYLIKVSALSDGTFTVTNTRNGFSKTYKPR